MSLHSACGSMQRDAKITYASYKLMAGHLINNHIYVPCKDPSGKHIIDNDGKPETVHIQLPLALWNHIFGFLPAQFHCSKSFSYPNSYQKLIFAHTVLNQAYCIFSNYRDIVFMDTTTGKLVRRLKGVHKPDVTAVTPFSSSHLFSGDNHGDIRLSNIYSGKITDIGKHTVSIYGLLILSPQQLLSYASDAIKVFDISGLSSTEQPVQLTLKDYDPICVVPWNKHRILIGSKYGKITLYDLAACKTSYAPENQGKLPIHCLAPLTDDTYASGEADGSIKLWDLRSEKSTKKLQDLQMLQYTVSGVSSLTHYPPHRIISTQQDNDGPIKVWDIRQSNTPELQFSTGKRLHKTLLGQNTLYALASKTVFTYKDPFSPTPKSSRFHYPL